jgi:3-hydroxyacyl-[acyl-carrier protein] dehydratase/trans-2-decenoyl-[acyl-carrier protein] isomerase
MTYQEFMAKTSFSQVELLAFSYGRMVEEPPADFDGRLPAPPFLMIDRILSMTSDGRRGEIVAEFDIRLDAWYFQCHMPGDPVQPGCLSVDAIWQLLGFYCLWRGGLGAGRALGCGEVAFQGQIRPFNRLVRYEIKVKRYTLLKDSGSALVIGDGLIFMDGDLIAEVKDARAGMFKGIVYRDYPRRSPNSVGGILRREP